jgi:hypothetical protein
MLNFHFTQEVEMRQIRLTILVATVVGLSGCATMFASGNDTVRLESEPPGATVTTQNGMILGSTPLTTSLKPDDYLLRFALEGYQEQTFALGREVESIAFLNLLCVLCWGIDFATGSVWGLEDDFVRVTMTPQSQANRDSSLQKLACHNYLALDIASFAGTLTQEQAVLADGVVAIATRTSRAACSPDDL